jgi:dihydrofolate synthase/folylpolyglutamate synthase
MSKISTIAEAETALLKYVPLVAKLTGEDSTLDRNRPLMAALGNPERKTRAIHIAGTSGKTSTAYFLAALLRASGKKVGLTVSPHVDSITERVQINGKPMSEEKFCAYLQEFLGFIESNRFMPTYFELLTAFSFWVFHKEKVDYMVLETGLGGRYDTTNLVERADKLCVITDIGFDHMNVLGNTIREIAYQKAGIIHPKNAVVMFAQSEDVNDVIAAQVSDVGAELHTTTEDAERKQHGLAFAGTMPEFQQRNWLLAHTAYAFLQNRDDLPELDEEQFIATQAIQVPGRMDIRQVGDKTIVMDGAHKGQKMQTFLQSFQHAYPNVKPAILIALKQGKEHADVAPLLASAASKVIVTTFDTSQDLPAVSIQPNELAGIFRDAGVHDVEVEPDHRKAYQKLLEGPEAVCVITGSFYLLSQLRQREHLA